jgi:hypothetical protein
MLDERMRTRVRKGASPAETPAALRLFKRDGEAVRETVDYLARHGPRTTAEVAARFGLSMPSARMRMLACWKFDLVLYDEATERWRTSSTPPAAAPAAAGGET